MASRLPEVLDLSLWTGQRREWSAVIPGTSFTRLALPWRQGEAFAVALALDTDEQGRRWLDGELRGQMPAVCQRCLGDMLVDVVVPIRYGIVAHESDGQAFEPEQDWCAVTDQRIEVLDLLEDELLLALPMIPMHAAADCAASDDGPAIGAPTKRPFAGLAALMKAPK